MTPSQCRAARGLLDWTQNQLAAASGVSAVTIRKFEKGKGKGPQPASLRVMIAALIEAGVIFIDDDRGEGVVKLRQL
jgi:transcriptional regulator with XRE-family HTH domain